MSDADLAQAEARGYNRAVAWMRQQITDRRIAEANVPYARMSRNEVVEHDSDLALYDSMLALCTEALDLLDEERGLVENLAAVAERAAWPMVCVAGVEPGWLDADQAAALRNELASAQELADLAIAYVTAPEGSDAVPQAWHELVGAVAHRRAVNARPTPDAVYLVWSNLNSLWWRPNGAGYTGDVWQAGRYGHAEALRACDLRTWSLDRPPPEVAVVAPENGRSSLTMAEIRALPEVMRARIAEATQARIADRQGKVMGEALALAEARFKETLAAVEASNGS